MRLTFKLADVKVDDPRNVSPFRSSDYSSPEEEGDPPPDSLRTQDGNTMSSLGLQPPAHAADFRPASPVV